MAEGVLLRRSEEPDMFVQLELVPPNKNKYLMKTYEIIKEMTMSAGSFEGLGNYINKFVSLNKPENYVGDIETFSVFKDPKLGNYAVFDGDDIAAFFQITKENNDAVIQAIYVLSEYRRKGLMSAIFWFLKRNQKFSRIILGDYHSRDTRTALDRIYKRFNAYWERNGERIAYDPSTADKFYSLTGPTGWRVVLENTNQALSQKTKFDPSDLGTWYFNLLD